MRRVLGSVLAIVLCACDPGARSAAGSATPSLAPLQAKEAMSFLESPGRPFASPDGKLVVVAPNGDAPGTALVFDRTGAKVGEISTLLPLFSPVWLPDSSGLLVARGTRASYSLEIVERDLKITPTGFSGGAPSSLRPSPDGRVVAVETTDQIWTFSREKPSSALPVAGTKGRQLVGWDANGNVMARLGNSIVAATTDLAPIELPADLETDRKVSFTIAVSPDRTVNVLGSTRDQGRGIYVAGGRAVDGRAPQGWVGPHAALVRHDGRVFVYDVIAGSESVIAVPERARILAATSRDIVWSAGDELYVTSVADGGDRLIVGAQPREAFYVPLGTDGLLIYAFLNKKAWLVDLHPSSP